MWLWTRAARPASTTNAAGQTGVRIPGNGGLGWNLEARNADGMLCETAVDADNRMLCNVRALWDIVDNPATEDDTITARDLSDVIGVLRSYPQACTCGLENHCANEGVAPCWGDLDALNWKDFKANYLPTRGDNAAIATIEVRNGVDAQTDW